MKKNKFFVFKKLNFCGKIDLVPFSKALLNFSHTHARYSRIRFATFQLNAIVVTSRGCRVTVPLTFLVSH